MNGADVVRRARRAISLIACGIGAVAGGACSALTDPAADVADLRGTWRYTGEQTAPALTLVGTLVIESQKGAAVMGRLSWEEQVVGGGTRVDGGAVSGRVIERTDVDFDVFLPAGERRHVARLTADTMRGAWVEVFSGRSGEFAAVRGTP